MSVDLAPVAIFAFVTIYTPGPNNILSASLGALHGYRGALPFLLGVSSGVLVLMTLCGSLSALLTAWLPTLTPALRWLGGAYILWLAWSVLRSGGRLHKGPEQAPTLRLGKGFALQFVNPKAIFFGLTVYSGFLASLLENPLAVPLVAVAIALVTFSAVSIWALGGHLIRRWLRTPRRARILAALLAAALLYTALDLAGLVPG